MSSSREPRVGGGCKRCQNHPRAKVADPHVLLVGTSSSSGHSFVCMTAPLAALACSARPASIRGCRLALAKASAVRIAMLWLGDDHSAAADGRVRLGYADLQSN